MAGASPRGISQPVRYQVLVPDECQAQRRFARGYCAAYVVGCDSDGDMDMIELSGALLLAIAAGLIAVAAWQDFTSWKIRNWTVLALVADYAVLALVRWALPATTDVPGLPAGPYLLSDLAAGLLLFGIGA